jgi:CheY-like chemotaxis protein
VTIRIKDSGIGIEPGMLPKIFDMFVQADNRIERSTGGLGIGLTLVRHFVELHGGSVHAASGGTNLGSEFTIRLPLGEAPVAATSEPRAPGTPAGPGAGLRILVIDDNNDNADTMSTLLRMLGHEVTVSNSGLEGLRYVADSAPDVALLDIGMPNMNGYEVAQRIRSQPHCRDMMLIAITGWGQEVDRVRSRAAGFDHHLVKPVDFDQLQKLWQRNFPGSRRSMRSRPRPQCIDDRSPTHPGHTMKNPWLKKNPLMSMWMSGANAMLGSARSRTMAEVQRQSAAMMAEGTRQMFRFWTGDLSSTPTRKRKKKSR